MTGADALLTVAIVLIAGITGGGIARRVGLPSVTGQILVGVVLGPTLFDVFDARSVASMQPLMHFALGLVAVMVGSHLDVRRLRNATRRLSILVIFETTVTPLLVLGGLLALGAPWSVAALLAALAVSTAPATVVALVREVHARGVFVKTLIAAVALDNIACILLFEVARSSALATIDAESGRSFLDALIAPTRQLALSALLGWGIGWLTTRVTRDVVRSDRLASASLVAILLAAGLADHWNVSPLLACLFLGTAFANLTPDRDEIGHRVFDDFQSAVFAIFFTLAGMQLHLDKLVEGGGIALALFSLRVAGKYVASRAAMRLAGATDRVERWLGLALVPQAGVAVGLLLLVGDDPELRGVYELLLAVGLAVVTLNEIIGPILTRLALLRSGDAGQDRPRLIDFLREENIVTDFQANDQEDAIAKLTDVLIRSNRLKVDRDALLESVLERERDVSTCIGEGLAIPHGILAEGERIVGAMAISREGLAFADTPDGRPVHCIVLLATPATERDRHLEVLAALARAIGADPQVQKQLYSARSAAHVYELLHAEESQDFNYFLE